MRSLIGGILNRAPIAYAPRTGQLQIPWTQRNDAEAQMRAMGSVGTLFAIVNGTSTATSAVDWHLYRKARSGRAEDRVEVTVHAALDLWTKPNKFFTRQELVEAGQQHIDLTGEGWIVIGRSEMGPAALRSIPLELWLVRPDRIAPVPSPEEYLVGYIYTGPSGEQVPLGLDQVMQIRMPNPLDPYRGMGPVQSILVDLDSTRYSAEWNRNFFVNSAEPGGVIEVDKRLSDDEFTEMRERWAETHKGVANAHRVAILEQGKWVNAAFNQRDMQFAELRQVSRDVIREAFGVTKFDVGDIDDVNRATAEASETRWAKRIVVPRLDRWRSLLNNDLLPLFGATGEGLEFDYDSPVPQDQEAEQAERESKAEAAKTYIRDIGFKAPPVLKYLGLPEDWELEPKPEPPAPPAVAAGGPDAGGGLGALPPANRVRPAHVHRRPANVSLDDIDLTAVQAAWEQALEDLLASWRDITAEQRDAIAEQVRAAVNSDDVAAIAAISVSAAAAAGTLTAAVIAMAYAAADAMADELAAQGVDVEPGTPDEAALAANATAVASLLAAGLANAAAREALRRYARTADGDEVAAAVVEHLEGLSDAFLTQQLGGALTGAQNEGRIATVMRAPDVAIYASEVLDKNTCGPCRRVNGRFLGNSQDPDGVRAVAAMYPNGGYVDCEGGARCRGTIVAIWRPRQVASDH